MAKDKPKIAVTILRSKSSLAYMEAKNFPIRIQGQIGMALNKAGLQVLSKKDEGYELRLAIEGPDWDVEKAREGGMMTLETEMFLLSAETGKRIANDVYKFSVMFGPGEERQAQDELVDKLVASHALKRIVAAVEEDAEQAAGSKKKKK